MFGIWREKIGPELLGFFLGKGGRGLDVFRNVFLLLQKIVLNVQYSKPKACLFIDSRVNLNLELPIIFDYVNFNSNELFCW